MQLELEFRVLVVPKGLDSSWQGFTASLFTPEHCVVFEAVVYRRANIDEEFARWAAAPERYFSSLTGTTPRTGFEGPQEGLFSEAPPGGGRAQAVDQVPREASSVRTSPSQPQQSVHHCRRG